MNREQAKEMFRNDKDSYGKPKHLMKNINKIYDEFVTDLKIAFNESRDITSWNDLGVKLKYDNFDDWFNDFNQRKEKKHNLIQNHE